MGAQQSLFNKQHSRQAVVVLNPNSTLLSELMSKYSVSHYIDYVATVSTMNDIIAMFRRIHRSSHAYPYPRTHSLVVVPSTRPLANDEDEANESTVAPKQRPPLNRAIPTIPESKSNESIMTQASERRDESAAESIPSTSRDHVIYSQQCSLNSAVLNRDDSKLRKSSAEDRSIVIENKLAQNLASKTAVSVTTKNECASETPKSPLMSVAYSVRTRLTKISNRFSRADTRQGIRSSYSLSSMRQRSSDKISGGGISESIAQSKLFKKSASMESRPTPCSTSSDSIKSSIPIRTPTAPNTPSTPTLGPSSIISPTEAKTSSRAKTLKLTTDMSTTDSKPLKLQPTVPTNGNGSNSSVEGARATHLNQPATNVSQSDSSGYRSNCLLASPAVLQAPVGRLTAATVAHPNRPSPKPPASRIAVPAARITSKVAATISGRSLNKSDAKTVQSEEMKKVEKNARKRVTQKEEQLSKGIANDQLKKTSSSSVKKVERSFIPLITSTPRNNDVRPLRYVTKTSKAPLAECESSRVENSPAVELPPINFDRISNSPNQRRRLAMRAEDGPATIVEESILSTTDNLPGTALPNDHIPLTREDSNGNVEITVARTTVSEDSQTSCWPLTSPAASSAETNRGLIDDEIKDQPLLIGSEFTAVDDFVPSSHWRCSLEMSEVVSTNQAGSQTSPVHMISSLNMASSGYMTSSGLLNSPPNDGDSHSELDSVEEQLSNLTICNAASRARARRSPVGAEVDGEFVVAAQPGPSHLKHPKVNRTSEGTVAFPDVATYESACQDVICIKNQLLELQRIINSSVATDQVTNTDAERPNGVSVERLLRENDALRKELAEKDRIISTLRAQIALN